LLFKKKKQRQVDDDDDDEERAPWCVVEYSDHLFRAQLQHMGRGKFKILNDNQEGIHIGRIVDASDIHSCEVS
jgi:hypothetical protein